jgi:hypothetical protein
MATVDERGREGASRDIVAGVGELMREAAPDATVLVSYGMPMGKQRWRNR